MIPQFIAILLHIAALYNCYKVMSSNRSTDHKVKAEIAMIMFSSMFFCVICVHSILNNEIDTLWQVYSVYNALTYAITTKRLSECSMTWNLSSRQKHS